MRAPVVGVHSSSPSRMFAFRNDSISDSTRAVGDLLLQAGHQAVVRDRVEVALQVGVHHVDISGLQELDRLVARRLCSRVPVGTRSCAPRSRARRSARSRSRPPPGPSDPGPWESPAAASRWCPAWGCERVGSTGADTCRASVDPTSSQSDSGKLPLEFVPLSRDRPRPRLSSDATCWNAASRFRSANTLSNSRNHLPPSTPCSRAVNMRTVQAARFDPSPTREDLSGLLSQRHCRRFVFRRSGHVASIFLEPFAPPALPGFVATMAPLTPAGGRTVDLPSGPGRSLCFMCLAFRPFRLQPPDRAPRSL